MRVIIAGSRSIEDAEMVREAIRESGFQITEVVSGGARGADRIGERIAEEIGVPVRRFPPDWQRYGRAAGPRRNEAMADYGDALVAVWDGKSRGTAHMIEAMRERGKAVHVRTI